MTRQRYLRQLATQAKAGDAGANAEFFVALARDAIEAGNLHARFCCEAAIRHIRQFRRQASREADAWLRRQLEGLGKEGAS